MSLLTLSEGKGSASFDADPLFGDGGYCGDGCSARDGGDVQPNMAATKTNGTRRVGARLRRAGRRREAAIDGCDENIRDKVGRGKIAPLGTKGGNPAARVLRLGRRGVLSKINAGCASCRFR